MIWPGLAVAAYAWIGWMIFRARVKTTDLDATECVFGGLLWPFLLVMLPFAIAGEVVSAYVRRQRRK